MAVAAQSEAQSQSQNIPALVDTLTTCLFTTGSSLPKPTTDEPSDLSVEPPADGISLLDTKTDLLLSYLQNLVFLIIFQLRKISSDGAEEDGLQEEIVKKLVELRVYLDRGVRPLESRLKYQIEKVIKAADDMDRAARVAAEKNVQESGSESGSGGESGSEDSEESEGDEDIDEMAYRPNVSAFSKGVEKEVKPEQSAKNTSTDGIYRPPKIMPTALPTTESRERQDRRSRKSHVIDEFVNAEMSSAPMAEPSIGSTITQGGRHTKSRKDKEFEAERTAYEETNFMRLPKETKKERTKRQGRNPQGTFGGEEWRGLTEGADRIERLTRRAKGSGNALDRSRKRKPTEDGPRGDGAGVGQIFEKRRKKVGNWKR